MESQVLCTASNLRKSQWCNVWPWIIRPYDNERNIPNVYCSPLKPFVPDNFQRYQKPLPTIEIDEQNQEYEIQAILYSKKIREELHFLVKWRGYCGHENTWRKAEDLKNLRDFLDAFNASGGHSPWLGGFDTLLFLFLFFPYPSPVFRFIIPT